jgi:hypothetical protein
MTTKQNKPSKFEMDGTTESSTSHQRHAKRKAMNNAVNKNKERTQIC